MPLTTDHYADAWIHGWNAFFATGQVVIGLGMVAMMPQQSRFDELRALSDGWLDGQGKAIAPAALRQMEAVLSASPDLANQGALFPTEEGGVVFEFKRATWDLSMEAEPDGTLEFYGVEIGSKNTVELTPFGDEQAKIAVLRALLKRMTNSTSQGGG